MASKDDIITLPHKHLRERSKKVGLITPAIRQLITDMESSALDWEDSRAHEVSVALAAVQIDSLLRVIVIRNNTDKKEDRTFTAFINPVITKYEGDIQEDYEGCLSVNEIHGNIPRHTKVRVKAMGINGKEIRVTAKGFLARIFQHEIDHTNGILIIDHIKDNTDAFFQLEDNGKLEALDYDKYVKDNKNLWGDGV